MINLKIWRADGGSDIITAPVYGQAFDLADQEGAVRALEGDGSIAIKISGEWVYLPLPAHIDGRK